MADTFGVLIATAVLFVAVGWWWRRKPRREPTLPLSDRGRSLQPLDGDWSLWEQELAGQDHEGEL